MGTHRQSQTAGQSTSPQRAGHSPKKACCGGRAGTLVGQSTKRCSCEQPTAHYGLGSRAAGACSACGRLALCIGCRCDQGELAQGADALASAPRVFCLHGDGARLVGMAPRAATEGCAPSAVPRSRSVGFRSRPSWGRPGSCKQAGQPGFWRYDNESRAAGRAWGGGGGQCGSDARRPANAKRQPSERERARCTGLAGDAGRATPCRVPPFICPCLTGCR